MANAQEFTGRTGRPPKYPWERWTDGRAHTLYQGEHFDADLISFRTMVHRKARDLSPLGGPRTRATTEINKASASIKIRFYLDDEH